MPTNVEYILKGCCLRKIKAWCNKGLESEGTMTVIDRNTIDITSIEGNGKHRDLVLYISDHLEWGEDVTDEHLRILQDKLNDYLE